MISIYQKRIQTKLLSVFALCCVAICSVPFGVSAQVPAGSMSLSVTPTLFQMAASPLQSWDSSIKVINNNNHPITVYANVVNFSPQGETGQGKFIPIFEEATDGTTLAEWISITRDPILIAPEQSYSIPFTVQVPSDPSPGGHFAAIMIGTKPPETKGLVQVKTSQVVTSLFFVRVAGDVIEEGIVREFRTVKNFVSIPEANFEVRFENKGNVHLQPQGEIVITNMWGKERGIIPINHQTHFGNVLPESIRKFEFAWKGDPSFTDIGRYKAVLALAYGEDSRKFVTSTAYFYVIPVKAGLTVLGSLLALMLLITWGIKMYVRRMLLLAGIEPETVQSRRVSKSFTREGDVRVQRKVSLKAPVQDGVLDLKMRLKASHAFFDTIKTLSVFVFSYKLFFIGLIASSVAIFVVTVFFTQVMEEQRNYEVTIDNADADIILSSEEIIYNRLHDEGASTITPVENILDQPYELVLINSSDIVGAAAALQKELIPKGYTIAELRSDFEESKSRSVVVYDVSLQEDALILGKLVGNALLSVRPQTASTSVPNITVFIGNDYSTE